MNRLMCIEYLLSVKKHLEEDNGIMMEDSDYPLNYDTELCMLNKVINYLMKRENT